MHTHSGFKQENLTPGLPTRSVILEWYKEVAGWDPAGEMAWADAFQVFRNSAIMQGIAARYALRQASSAAAKEHGELMGPFGEFGWKLVQTALGKDPVKAKL